MSTTLNVIANLVDSAVNYQTTPADYIAMDLAYDYLIWTERNTIVKDRMIGEPTSEQLNEASSIIDPDLPITVSKCLVMDYSHNWESAYYTYLVKGMGENARYVFGFSFDGATATEPQLECWDDSDHDSTLKHVLGAGTPANSMVKGVCTTHSLPGASWIGVNLAGNGAGRYLKLNGDLGALAVLESGITSQELYANLKIVIPANYATPAVETFVMTVRYTFN